MNIIWGSLERLKKLELRKSLVFQRNHHYRYWYGCGYGWCGSGIRKANCKRLTLAVTMTFALLLHHKFWYSMLTKALIHNNYRFGCDNSFRFGGDNFSKWPSTMQSHHHQRRRLSKTTSVLRSLWELSNRRVECICITAMVDLFVEKGLSG